VHTVAVIGAGKIGEVLLSGLLRSGWPAGRLLATARRAEHRALAEELFAPLGRTVRVPESQQDAVTALSGSGPAYFFYLVEAMTDAGILLGLPRQVAHDLIVQTAIGSAIMLRDSGEHPVKLREAVTSPAGTTINAIRELENHGVRAALLAALEAARDRAKQIADQQS
jgi:pyrroline-5-carboxylate reductase